ncbi:hypothetical protein V496_10056 [Pseudogymnoascus sp. VKM F-4515 (FW-2607)]|nr:hypothetical protein V496_10056 [Pseudogymnoascus sp. VKM F-4515 (FW-2607)]KFY90357.1 hypothetical protein V498_06028 [Pseudogymnoascus sp. VKM F-4517 (FW-2822)]
MFRNRVSSQKPGDDLYAHFKANFGNVVGATTAGTSSGPSSLDAVVDPSNLMESPGRTQEEMKDLDPTPRAQNEPWRFTPSLLDPNSYAFSAFANQMPAYYTPGANGNPLYHSQAGDLHTPSMGIGMGVGTPLSMQPGEGGVVHPGQVYFQQPYPQQQALPPQSFQNNYTGYPPTTGQEQQQQQQSFAPAAFLHHDTSYDTMDHDGSPMQATNRIGQMEATSMQPPMMTYQPRQYEINAAAPLPASAEKFRFHVVLNAPTAMISNTDEIPVTYLNKGQAYSVSIVDTQPMLPVPVGTRYRTFVRISFEDEQQRQRPASCWQLWKEGRGTNEAHQRGGKLQAVEYVEATQQADSDDKRTRVELESASFDGFSVVWTPGAAGLAECTLAVRFNFLSTDFSHSKGVKGIPVRCCAKTEILDPSSPHAVPGSTEVAYCKVKLFRDHGAERKLSNDVQHVKKTIDKLKQQITQAEAGMKDFGKRKRTGSISKATASQRAGKVPKHKRTWSMSSASSAGGHLPVEEDLHYKLQQQQDMFTSTRPVSILYLRGAEQDDPDLHPVALPGSGEQWDLTKVDSRESAAWQHRTSVRSSSTAGTSSLVSPSPSSTSLHSQAMLGSSIPVSAQWGEYNATLGADVSSNPQHLASPPDQLTKIPKTDDTGSLSGWIEALGVDSSYRPPAVPAGKAVACFYVQYRDASATTKKPYYRAVYLAQRTLSDLLAGVGGKWGLDPSTIRRTLRVLPSGLEVEMDDEVVREMREGQDVVFEVKNLAGLKREWEMTIDDDAEGEKTEEEGCELRLLF